MKNILIVCVFALMGGCVYDPPQKGNIIYIHNQTDQYVFVIDSLPSQGNARLYDTSLVNGRRMISAIDSNIPAFGTCAYFLSENHYRYQKLKNKGNVTLYFIAEKDITKTYDKIKHDTFYRVFSVDADTVMTNGINHIFYYNDTIFLEHIFDTE
ncbi:hypothetical protein A4H97_14815 [Niastella yeongjuensis]|uniref:Uncharacterized protein n=1 Tax=Niastella yeongjuensis TaxID=354355 RepID=A0A1V9E446_9BACT|nr:hypothetical protein [Niastella yeongjuensis]OQP40878.1 hypothetical protein A4H97_14815 [Niastella yeongjuensis]SEO99136.1 hypothetical protein SAMN05660816_04088 [Niastella yeongjuensis]